MKRGRISPPPTLAELPSPLPIGFLRPLLDFTQSHLGQTAGVAEQLCQEVNTLTQGYGLLELRFLPFPHALTQIHIPLPVSLAGFPYGTLHLLTHPRHPHRTVLSVQDGQLLADCIAQQCSLLELHALFQTTSSEVVVLAIESLTDQEKLLLHQLLRDAPLADIAGQLQRSVRTVERHCSNIYSKLGVSTRLHAILLSLRFHLISLLAPPSAAAAASGKRSYTKRHRS